jgi:pilus assembly protein Flp/PilA
LEAVHPNRAGTGEAHMKIMKILKSEDGATAIEYGLIAALIAVAAITAMGSLGTNLSTTFNNVSSNLVSS